MDLFPSLSPSPSFLPLVPAAANDDVAATSDCQVDSRSCGSSAAPSLVLFSRLHSQTDPAGYPVGRPSKTPRTSDHWTTGYSARTVPRFSSMTDAQLKETEQQTMIYRLIASGQRPPAWYLQALSKTTAVNQAVKCLQTPMSATATAANSEPNRCRRTDGKKWRCSRDVVLDQKYCERHLNRGRSNSRKLQQPVAAASVAAAAGLHVVPGCGGTSTSSSRSSLTTAVGDVDTSPKVPRRLNYSLPDYNFDNITEANHELSQICFNSGFQQIAPPVFNLEELKNSTEGNLDSLKLMQGSKFNNYKVYSNPDGFALFRSPGFDFLPLTIPRHDCKTPDTLPAVPSTNPLVVPDVELPGNPATSGCLPRPPFEFCDVARWGGPLAEALRFPLSNFDNSSFEKSSYKNAKTSYEKLTIFDKSNLEKSNFDKCSLLTGCSSNCTSQWERQSESSSSGSTSNSFSTVGLLSKSAAPHVSSCSSS